MSRLRKLKDEDKYGVVVFADGSSVVSARRFVSSASNVLYFETDKGVASPHGKAYMETREGLVGWAVPVSSVKGVK